MTNPILLHNRPLSICWGSSSPFGPFGYSTTTRAVVPRLRDRLGCRVSISAYYGLENGKLNWRGIDVYSRGMDSRGNDIHAANAKQAGADLLITHQDVWAQNPTQLTQAGTRWVSWPPLDSEPIAPQIAKRLQETYQTIALSRFGQEQAGLAGLDVPLVSQGVDTQLFCPGDRREARERLGWPADAFIVGMIAHNKGYPSRKAYPEQLTAFAQFARRHSDALIYLHCYGAPELDPEAPPLPWLLGDMEDRAIWAKPYDLNIGYSDEQMVDRYRALDVLLGCSLSEGFGIPLVEAQSCGIPVITGAWTAMRENCGSGWLIPREESEPFACLPLECWWRTPHISAIEDRLEEAYGVLQTKQYRSILTRDARSWAVRERDQDMLVDTQWRAVLENLARRIEEEPTPFHRHTWPGVGIRTGQGVITSCLTPDCPAELRVNGTREVAEKGWDVQIDGIRLSIEDDPNGGVKHAIAEEIVKTYHLDELSFEPGDIVLDIGAHVGVVSCYLAKKWPQIKIYAIEPTPENFWRLERNIEVNGLKNITPWQGAVTGDGRDLTLWGDPTINSGHYSAYAEHGSVSFTVRSIILPDLLSGRSITRIALLKLDCEGAEYEILHSLGRSLSYVEALAMEVHENERLCAAHGTGADLVAFARTNVPWVRASVIQIPEYEEVGV